VNSDGITRSSLEQGACVVILAIVVALVVIVGLIIGVVSVINGEPNEIRIKLSDERPQVASGDEFTIEIEIENVSTDTVRLVGVGVGEDLLDGLAIVRTEPAYSELKERKRLFSGEWSHLTFDQNIIDGVTSTINVTLRAEQSGAYKDEISVWVENDLLFGITSISRARKVDLRVDVG
jgi:hypothetical protein